MFKKVFGKIKDYVILISTTIAYILLLIIMCIGGFVFFAIIGVVYLIYLFFKVLSDALSSLFE